MNNTSLLSKVFSGHWPYISNQMPSENHDFYPKILFSNFKSLAICQAAPSSIINQSIYPALVTASMAEALPLPPAMAKTVFICPGHPVSILYLVWSKRLSLFHQNNTQRLHLAWNFLSISISSQLTPLLLAISNASPMP